MRIKSIYVNNFKSLVDFNIKLAKFNCFIGLNGSGKSTFLQFIDFLIHLMKGDVDAWFKRRDWQIHDIYNHLDRNKVIKFTIVSIDDNGEEYYWSATYNQKSGQLDENIQATNVQICTFYSRTGRDRLREISYKESPVGNSKLRINFKYQGSIFSSLDDESIPKVFYDFRDFILSMESFELLAPHFLRQRTRESEGSIGLEGKGLASFLHEIGEINRKKIVEQLVEVYPQLRSIDIKRLRAGWKQLEIKEEFNATGLKAESRHISDGMLRLIAILAQLQSNRQVVVFDEIENGINPELVGFLLNKLVDTKKQVVVTTHSPLFLNYVEDDLAKESVKYFYRTPDGYTRCIPFFDIPSIKQKLGVLGPGEAFADTDLVGLAREIEQITVLAKED